MPITNSVSIHFQLLRLRCLLEASATPAPSTGPWKNYSALDYPSPQDYCRVCLLNENAPTNPAPNASLCYLPVVAPDGKGVNLDALMAAQKTLLDPDSLDFPVGDGEHQRAAQKLLQVMQTYDLKPDHRLMAVAEVEEDVA